jgi:predicted amidohydrolase
MVPTTSELWRSLTQTPVFRVGGLTLGIVICNDSTFSEPAKAIAGQGATALFIPTNNGLPEECAYPGLVQEARASDFARVAENRFWVIRADVAGTNGELVSHGSSRIVDPDGKVVQDARPFCTDLLVASVAV